MDGWHTIKGYEVYVENGKITHGIKNGKTAYLYRWESSSNAWVKGNPTISAFRGDNWELK